MDGERQERKMEDQAFYPGDKSLIAQIDPDVRARFEAYMSELDQEHVKRCSPYGEGTLWSTTGAACWFSYFEDGRSPSEALDEDLSYAD